MRKQEIEDQITEIRIEREVEKRVRLRCVAFWSGILTIAAIVGQWLSNNLIPVKAAARAFWEAWGQK